MLISGAVCSRSKHTCSPQRNGANGFALPVSEMCNPNESETILERRRFTPAGGSATRPSFARSKPKARSWSTAPKKERHSKFTCRVINASPGQLSYVIFEQRRRGRNRSVPQADGRQVLGRGLRRQVFAAVARARAAGAYRQSVERVRTRRARGAGGLRRKQICRARLYRSAAPRTGRPPRRCELRSPGRDSNVHSTPREARRADTSGKAGRERRAVRTIGSHASGSGRSANFARRGTGRVAHPYRSGRLPDRCLAASAPCFVLEAAGEEVGTSRGKPGSRGQRSR